MISVIIPSYNSAATIARTLDSLLAQEKSVSGEIFVIDSSDDGKTPAILSGYEKRGVRVTRLQKKTGPAAGRNLGAGQAGGKVLAFIDSDAYAAPDWTAKIAAAVEGGCRMGGGSLLIPDFQRNKALALAQYFLQFNEFLDTGKRRVKVFVPSVNLFCEKALFDELGGFPDIRASEDVLFGLATGKKTPVYFDPAIKVYHIFREDLGAYLRNQVMLGKYILIYRRKYYGGLLYNGAVPILLLPAFLLLKLVRITARIFMTGKPGEIGRFILSLPLFLLGAWYWAVGFFQGCFDKESF